MKKFLSLLLSIVLVISCMGVASARAEEGEKKTYIVVLDAPAVYSPDRVTFYGADDDDAYRQALLELQAEVKAQINGGVSAYSLRNTEKTYSYTDVLNGFTVNVDASTAESIKKIDGVKGVYEDKIIGRVKPVEEGATAVAAEAEASGEAVQVSQANSGNMINTASAYEKGYNGKGRAIAIVDTAMHPEHIYYTLSDEATAKYTMTEIGDIIENNEMKASATADDVYKSAKIPFAYDYAADSATVTGTELHGEHVAGIAAGNSVSVSDGVISGVAPEAQILFFGVFQPGVGAATSDIAAALEDVVKFDVDAVNLSLGADYASENLGDTPYYDAVKAVRNAGITVVFGAGNADRASYSTTCTDYSAADSQNYQYSSKIGSVINEYAYMPYLEDDAGNKYPCVAKGSEAELSPLGIVDCGSGTQAEIDAVDVSGKIAVITRPDPMIASGFKTYGTRAVNEGAAAVVIVNNSIHINDGNSGYAYPLFVVSKASGPSILSATTLKYTGEEIVQKRAEITTANQFSSYGYADNLDISVDFSAPGGNIYSSYGSATTFANLSGTSMATPQVAGATSLMYQYVEEAFPTYTGASKVMLVKNLLASTAQAVYEQNGALTSPRKVGAGLIQLDKAMTTKVILKGKNSDETKINLGADLTKSFDVTFTAYNLGNSDITFNDVSVDVSSDDYKNYGDAGYGYNGLKKLDASISGDTSVTVPAGGSVDVTVSATLSDTDIAYLSEVLTNGFFIDGKVTLSGEDNCDVGIPFSGFYGDWAAQPIMSESRFLNYFYIEGYAEDGFMPPAMILKENSQIVMPVADEVSADVAEIPTTVTANSARNAFMTVKCDGVTVVEDAFLNKFYDFGYYMEEILLADLSGISVITVELRLPYESEPSNIYTINIVEDNEKPVISDIYVQNEEGKDYTYLAVSDNYGVGAVTAMATNGDGKTVYSDAYILKSSATLKFNITELDNLNYFVYDCAFNMTELTPDISIDVTDGVATYTNNTHKALTGECMIAVYEGGKMTEFKKLSSTTSTIDAYDTLEFDVSEYDGMKYKLFFWSDMESIVPVCDAYEAK